MAQFMIKINHISFFVNRNKKLNQEDFNLLNTRLNAEFVHIFLCMGRNWIFSLSTYFTSLMAIYYESATEYYLMDYEKETGE
jgi:hypothetical protein